MIFSFQNRPLIGAHRGASAEAPENTIAAFDLAVEQGAELIELDVHMSADGYLVVLHDFDLQRTAGLKAMAGDLDLAALLRLDVGSWKDPRFAGERMPTLDGVLARFGQRVLLNVEIKVGAEPYAGIEDAVAATIVSHGLVDRVVVSTFDAETFVRIRQHHPAIRASLLVESPPGPTAVAPDDLLGSALALAENSRAAGVHLEHTLVTRDAVDQATSHGLGVLAWTVDDEPEMRRLAALGVDVILSNRPGVLRELVLPFRASHRC